MISTSYQHDQRQILKRNKLDPFIPVLNILREDKIFIIDGNALGALFICSPSPGVNGSQEAILEELFKMSLPANTVIQSSLIALPDIVRYMNGWSAKRGGRIAGVDKAQADTLNAMTLDYINNSQYQPLKPAYDNLSIRNFELWFSFRFPIKAAIPTSKELKKVKACIREIMAKLTELGIAPLQANENDWLYCVKKILNPGKKSSWSNGYCNATSFTPLNKQVLDPGRVLIVNDDNIASRCGGKREDEQRFFKTLSVNQFPEKIEFGAMYSLVVDWLHGNKTVYSPFIITLTVLIPEQTKEKKEFVRYKAVVSQQAKIPLALTFSPSLKDMFDDYMAMTAEIESGAKLLRAYLSFTVMSSTEEGVNEAAEQMRSFYENARVNIIDDNYVMLGSLLSQLPLCNDPETIESLERDELYSNKGVAQLVPLFAAWKGNTTTPVVELVSREGQLMGIDIFETDGAYNAAVAATSGAGKSFLIAKLLMSYMGAGKKTFNIHWRDAQDAFLRGTYPNIDDGSQIFVVDVGRSYEGVCSQYSSSQFIDFGSAPTFTLNPFSFMTGVNVNLEKSNSDDDEGDIVAQTVMALNILKMMASESGTITDLQQAVMLALIKEEYDEAAAKSEVGSVTSYAERCIRYGKEKNEPSMTNIGVQLMPWTEYGVYGSRFSNKLPPINFNSRFIVLELEELKGTPHLQTVVLMSVIQAVQYAMFIKRDGKRRIFVLEEAWEHIKQDQAKGTGTHANNAFLKAFLEAAWRRFRKTNCAGICITQSFEDYYNSEVGKAIANNSPWKFILKQEEEAIDALMKHQSFSTNSSSGEYEWMKNIRTVKGVFSEILIRFGGVKQIGRLYVDRRSELCFTTNPADREKLWALQKSGYTYAEAIEHVYQQELLAAPAH